MTFILLFVALLGSNAAASTNVVVPKGVYKPVFREPGETDVEVGPLVVDSRPVTNEEYATFVRNHPQFRRSRIPSLFADSSYLSEWSDDVTIAKGTAKHPVVYVSWFAARRFCEAKGMRLPTIAEWEYLSGALDPGSEAKILAWYAIPKASLRDVGHGQRNRFGLTDTLDHTWEWVDDFSQTIMSGDSRGGGATEGLFCGGAALKAKDPTLYAAYMRFAFRSSLVATYASKNLGFRCVKNAGETK